MGEFYRIWCFVLLFTRLGLVRAPAGQLPGAEAATARTRISRPFANIILALAGGMFRGAGPNSPKRCANAAGETQTPQIIRCARHFQPIARLNAHSIRKKISFIIKDLRKQND